MTLVLLHALPFGGAMWDALTARLEPGCAVVAPDLADLGESIVDWGAAVLDLVPAGPLTVVGCSVGGSCAVEVAIRAPRRVRHLVLIGTKPGHRPEPELRDEALRVLATEGLAAAWERWWDPLLGPDTAPAVRAAARAQALAQDVTAVARAVRAFHGRPDRSDWPRAASCPVDVVEGAHDRPARARELTAALPAGRLHVVPDVGHYVPIEAPARLAAVVAAALAPAG